MPLLFKSTLRYSMESENAKLNITNPVLNMRMNDIFNKATLSCAFHTTIVLKHLEPIWKWGYLKLVSNYLCGCFYMPASAYRKYSHKRATQALLNCLRKPLFHLWNPASVKSCYIFQALYWMLQLASNYSLHQLSNKETTGSYFYKRKPTLIKQDMRTYLAQSGQGTYNWLHTI